MTNLAHNLIDMYAAFKQTKEFKELDFEAMNNYNNTVSDIIRKAKLVNLTEEELANGLHKAIRLTCNQDTGAFQIEKVAAVMYKDLV